MVPAFTLGSTHDKLATHDKRLATRDSFLSATGYIPPMPPRDDDDLDDEFPLGDGTAATDAIVTCPYCSQTVDVTLDPGSGSKQEYVEDCGSCCRPLLMTVHYRRDGSADVSVSGMDE
jgi:hypothetical protein